MHKLDDRGRYSTGMASQITGIPVKTIISYEQAALSDAKRSLKGRRIFSERDLFQLLLIKYLINEKNMSFDGIKVVLNLRKRLIKAKSVDLLDYILPEKIRVKFRERVS